MNDQELDDVTWANENFRHFVIRFTLILGTVLGCLIGYTLRPLIDALAGGL